MVDARVTRPSLVKRCVSFVAWWSPELFGAAAAFVAVVVLWPLTGMSGALGLVGVTQVAWLSLAGVALLGRIAVSHLLWALQPRRVLKAQEAAARRQEQDQVDTAGAEEVSV